MNFHEFLVDFLLFLLLASFLIIGFYIITRGERLRMPDGSIKLRGKIFKQWSLFWERTTSVQRLYYQGEELRKKFEWLQKCNAPLAAKLTIIAEGTSLTVVGTVYPDEYVGFQELLQCQAEIKDQSIFLYIDEPVYYFPEWLRFPLSQCPPCMASVYGTVMYWSVFSIVANAFSWSASPVFALLYFWVIFCISLSAVNKLLYNYIGV